MNSPLRATSFQTLTSWAVISPRTSTSSWAGTLPATAVKMRPSFSTSGMPGRTSSAMKPLLTLTASGTSSPPSASRTDLATAMPAFSCASSVEAPRCGVTTTDSCSKSGRLGGRLGGEDVDAGAGDAALGDGARQGGLVDDAAAGGVDDAHRGLDLGERLLADEAERLGRLRQVDGDEVGLGEQLVEAHELDAELAGLGAASVGVVGDDLHAEALEPLGDEGADAAEADDADGLVEQLDAGVLAALPRPRLEGRVGRRRCCGPWRGAGRRRARRRR